MKIDELLKEAYTSLEEQRYEDAKIYLKTVLELEKTNLNALMTLTRYYIEIQNYRKAMKYCSKAYRYYGDEKEVIFYMGYLCQEMGKNKKALIYYEKYIEKEENYHILLNIAICYMDMRYYNKSMAYIERAIKIDSENVDAYLDKAECLKKKKKYKEAIDLYKSLIDNEKIEESTIYMKIGDIYFKEGNIEKAIENYNISINCDYVPNSTVYEKFYDILLETEKEEEIEFLIINYSNSSFPKEASLNMEGRFAVYKKDYKRAENVCHKLIALEPEDKRNYFNLIFTFEKQEKYKEALDIYSILEKKGIEKEIIKIRKQETQRLFRNFKARNKRKEKRD